MDPREELHKLIVQAKEHLRYFSELGLTSIGERSKPAAAVLPESDSRVTEPPQPITPAKTEQEKPAPAVILPPQFLPKPTIIMPTKKEMPTEPSLFSEPSLFGEISAPTVEEQGADETLEDIRRDLGDCQRCKLW